MPVNFRKYVLENQIERKKSCHKIHNIEAYEYGKILHISDPEGNRIELWEAIDTAFNQEKVTEMR